MTQEEVKQQVVNFINGEKVCVNAICEAIGETVCSFDYEGNLVSTGARKENALRGKGNYVSFMSIDGTNFAILREEGVVSGRQIDGRRDTDFNFWVKK